MNDKDKNWPPENCLRNGCQDGYVNAEYCKYCGFDKDEHERRLKLPLVKGADGLRRMNVYVPGRIAPRYKEDGK